MKKIKEALNISEDILSDLELSRVSLEQICLKCLRLARLINDTDSIKWFSLEINWYDYNNIIKWIDSKEYFNIWKNHWRLNIIEDPITKEKKENIYSSSISELEALIESNKVALLGIKTPESYAPAVSSSQTEGYYTWAPLKYEFVQEKFWDVVNKIQQHQSTTTWHIKSQQATLWKIRANIYQYVLEKNYELKYWNTVETIFSWIVFNVEEKLPQISSEANEILSTIYDNLLSDKNEDWSNAVHSCRKVFQLFVDNLRPTSNEDKVLEWWKKIKMWQENYINRLIDYIESMSSSNTFKNIVWWELKYIWERIDWIYNSLNKWTHKWLEKKEAERYVIYTFLLLSDIMSLI